MDIGIRLDSVNNQTLKMNHLDNGMTKDDSFGALVRR